MAGGIKEARKVLDYLIEENRRKTFKKWIFSEKDKCNADKMAEAGFIFTGNKIEPDSVKCFVCNKSLDGWDSTDDPWKEHIKHSPNCYFAKLQRAQNNLTIKEFLKVVHVLTDKLIVSYYDDKAEAIEEQYEEYEQTILRTLEK